MNKKVTSCTAMLVGKNASIDGSTMIARDEDGYNGINPKTFKVFLPRIIQANITFRIITALK